MGALNIGKAWGTKLHNWKSQARGREENEYLRTLTILAISTFETNTMKNKEDLAG
jgi:hypothetical protein